MSYIWKRYSHKRILRAGSPQGSPLFFLIYIKDTLMTTWTYDDKQTQLKRPNKSCKDAPTILFTGQRNGK